MKIGIVGLGLIGGSLGFDLRSQGHEIFGISRREKTCQEAIDIGAVDRASPSFELLETAELVFVCTPLSVIVPTVEQLCCYLSSDAIITDVGSAKQTIVNACQSLWSHFVGGHPMAGRDTSGLAAAQSNLFAGTPYVLTPTECTPASALDKLTQVVQSLNVEIYQTTPEKHDRAVAWISHLPAIASASLITACMEEPDPTIRSLAQTFASSGFRDTSRVGGGNPQLGCLMARYNQPELLRSLQRYQQTLERLIAYIEQADWDALDGTLQQTQKTRPAFLQSIRR